MDFSGENKNMRKRGRQKESVSEESKPVRPVHDVRESLEVSSSDRVARIEGLLEALVRETERIASALESLVATRTVPGLAESLSASFPRRKSPPRFMDEKFPVGEANDVPGEDIWNERCCDGESSQNTVTAQPPLYPWRMSGMRRWMRPSEME